MDLQTILVCVLASVVMGWFLAAIVFSALCKRMVEQIGRTGHVEIKGRLFKADEVYKTRYPFP